MLAHPPVAVEAYAAGVAVGTLLPLALGITLLVVGLRQRRVGSTTATTTTSPPSTWSYGPTPTAAVPPWGQPPPSEPSPPPTASPTTAWPTPPPPSWPTPPPPAWPNAAPTAARGTGLIIAGSILTGLAVLGGGLQASTLATTTERRVALPSSVLGLERAEGAGAQMAESALQAAPQGLIDPRAALYGTPGLSVLVIAARARTAVPSRQVESFREGFEGSGGGRLTDGRDVKAGKLGGSAQCWLAHISDTTPSVCIFVDRGSLVATIDFLPGGVEEAAKRGLQIREATVHET